MNTTSERTAGAGLAAATCSPFFVFDVESIGLHGEGFAVAGGVYIAGAAQWEFCFCCPMDKAEGLQTDRDWVSRNVPVMEETHRDTYGLRLAFWQAWEKAKAGGAEMAAECLWPVEARFLQDCIRDDAQRLPTAPYPCHEIASVMLSAGMNPMATYDRPPSEMPRHNPLADARQSARLLSEALARMGNSEMERDWNAQLIALAPELAEALRDLLGEIDNPEQNGSASQQARALLARLEVGK